MTSSSQDLLLPSAAAAGFIFRTFTHRQSWPSLLRESKNSSVCPWPLGPSPQTQQPSLKASPAFPDTAVLLPLPACPLAHVLLAHWFRSLITWLCPSPRVIDCIIVPHSAQVLIPEPRDVNFYGKRAFADVIRWKILRWGDFPGLSDGSDIIMRNFLRGKQENKDTESDLTMEAGKYLKRLQCCFPRWRKGQWTEEHQIVHTVLESGKARTLSSPGASRGSMYLWRPGFWPIEIRFALLTSKLCENKFLLF